MSRIDVSTHPSRDGWECSVIVRNGRQTSHRVSVSRADLGRLAPTAADPTPLVIASFEFLLEREPAEAILREFDLPVIGRYFPEYEQEMAARLGR